jgi:hypothetical protein
MIMTDDLTKRVAEVEAQAKVRFGDDWTTALAAVGRATGGIDPAVMKQLLATPDPASLLMVAGKEQLLVESDAGDKNAEYEFSRIREKERANHRKLRGR